MLVTVPLYVYKDVEDRFVINVIKISNIKDVNFLTRSPTQATASMVSCTCRHTSWIDCRRSRKLCPFFSSFNFCDVFYLTKLFRR